MSPTPLALKRAVRDVKVATESSALAAQGIYYIPNEDNIMHGIAMLVGQKGTPYVGGYYFLDITFPDDYPFSPLKVKSLTQDGQTRFNPNLYVDGKVCLSVLNTWHDGPQWCGIQSLESVLMVIMSDVLCEIPLQGEPAYRTCGMSEESKIYNRIVFHSNVRTAVIGMLKSPPRFADKFMEHMKKEFEKNKEHIIKALEEHEMFDGKTETNRAYGMTLTYRYNNLKTAVSEVYNA
jgi:ubiquitin-protein ligase